MNWLKRLFGGGEDQETQSAREHMLRDAQDPRKRFVFGILAMSYEVDPGYLASHSGVAIREWYGIKDRDDLVRRIKDYAEGYNDDRAYDTFLGTFLARAGFGAQLLGEDESWQLALETARPIQAAYSSWADYGKGYLQGHIAYRKSQGDDAAALQQYRENISKRIALHERDLWPKTPFNTQL